MSLDYDLYVLDPENKDTKEHQIRDCIYDAIVRLAEKSEELERRIMQLEKSQQEEK